MLMPSLKTWHFEALGGVKVLRNGKPLVNKRGSELGYVKALRVEGTEQKEHNQHMCMCCRRKIYSQCHSGIILSFVLKHLLKESF